MKHLRVILLCFGLILLSVASYNMLGHTFWGNYTLGFFLGAWLIICTAISPFWSNEVSRHRFLLSSISGILLAVGFPPLPLPAVLFVAFIPALIVQDQIEISDIKHKTWNQFLYIYNSFVLWNILATYWVSNSALLPFIAAFGLNALFMSVPWLGMIRLGRRLPRYKYIGFIAFWLCWEWIHLHWEISWPWLTLGNAWASVVAWVQWYEFTGVFGGGLWILILNVLVFLFWKKRSFSSKKEITLQIVLITSMILIPILISLSIYYTYQAKGHSAEVVIIQPNYEPHLEKFRIPEKDQFTRFVALSNQSITPQTEYLIWPETSLANDYPLNIDALEKEYWIKQCRDSIINIYHGLTLVSGMTSIKFYKPDEKHGPAVRQSRRDADLFYEIHNCAVQIQDSGQIPIYFKSKLVPGPEIFPYKNLLPFLQPIIDKMGGTAAGLATQKERTAFDNGKHKIAPVICYESIYGDFMRGYFDHGAQAIFIMTNDGWWDNTLGYIQHAMYASLHAIEFRKDIARSANTGISCTIDQRGIIHQPRPYGVQAVLRSNILFNNYVSVYQCLGDIIAYIAILITFLLIIFSFIKRNRA